jgi:S1-C subfamily serine protease
MMQSLRQLLFALLVLALALAVFGWLRSGSSEYGLLNLLRGEKPEGAVVAGPTVPVVDPQEVSLLSRLDQEYSVLAEAVLPSVVSVTTKTVRQGAYGWHPFFGLVGRQAQVIPGLGSGAIISREGHLVTNYHVIEGVNEVIVTTHDNKKYPAKVLGASRQRDIALLKIETNRQDFPALAFADSDAVRVGQLVLAVGNPFGLSGTVTRGIISARDRHLSDSSLDYLQTDAVINPGNSGGPLVNVRGEILGINVAIYRGDENVRAWQGVGLAVPAKDVQEVVRAVLKKEAGPAATTQPLGEDIVPGFLGIDVAAEAVTLDEGLGLGEVGALVVSVVPGSPAQAAGILPGDVITSFNQKPFRSPTELLKRIQSQRAGQNVVVSVVRGNQELELAARLGAQASES